LEQEQIVDGINPSKHEEMLSSGTVRAEGAFIRVIQRPAQESGQRPSEEQTAA
jgi:hypothetical protein